MNVFDLNHLDDLAPIDTDVCIIGSGAAGMTLANELSGYNVLVVESGGVDDEPATQALYDIKSIGDIRTLDQTSIRRRVLGGSTHVWSGRCVPFDAVDYEERPWVPLSGWPIGPRDMAPYLDRAGPYLLTDTRYDELWDSLSGKSPQQINSDTVEEQFFQASLADHGAPVHFGRDLNPDVELLLHANVVKIGPQEVHVRSLGGRAALVRAKVVVLCTGGVENARLLLASRIGNDNVGRFLMDHIGVPAGAIERRGLDNHFGRYLLKDSARRNAFDYGLRLTRDIQRREELLNSHAFVLDLPNPNDPWMAFHRFVSNKGRHAGAKGDAKAALAGTDHVLRTLYRRLAKHRPPQGRQLQWHLMLEQAPNRDSRLRLGDAVDALGMPIAVLDWRVGALERRTAERSQVIFEAAIRDLGLPVPRRLPLGDDWLARTTERAHPTGTTRMTDDPAAGVVDRNGELHGEPGIYIAGSSVFPTAGAANPTLMIVAMTIRLADHLKQKLAPPIVRKSLQSRYERRPGRARVGLIGASKRALTVYLPVLTYLGYEVVGFTARSTASAYRLQAASGAPRFEDPGTLAAASDFLIVSVSDDESERIVLALATLDKPMLCETPLAWTADGTRRIIATGNQRIGVAEQFPLLPQQRLLRQVVPLIGDVRTAINDGAVYAYHGIAQLRAFLKGTPVAVTGDTVTYDNGQTLIHRGHAAAPETRVIGTKGMIVDDRLLIDGKEHRTERASDGSLSLAGETWHNPYPGLSDEQIAVASCVEAVLDRPLYTPADFLVDIELLQSLRYAAHGMSVTLPLNDRIAKRRRLASIGFWREKLRRR